MKFVRFLVNDYIAQGVLEGDQVVEIHGEIFGNFQLTEKKFPLKEVKLLPPIVPGKIVAIGLNYKKHAEEVNKPLPEEPMMFLVSPSAVIATGETIELVNQGHKTEHEGELAIVIGKQAKEVSEMDALDYVFGYTCCNDVSDRHLQKKDGQFTRAKSFATYKPLGPVIETNLNPDALNIQVRVNGEIKQDSNTSDMIFSTCQLISFVSQVITLDPGDVIITGTPSGVSPLRPGDEVQVDIEGIGTLVNQVAGKK